MVRRQFHVRHWTPTRSLLRLGALAALVVLPACDGLADPAGAPFPGGDYGAADVLPGTGNVWLGDDSTRVEEKLDAVQALALTAIRASTGPHGLTGGRTAGGAAVVEACRRRGLRVLFGVNAKIDSLAGVDLDAIRAGGATWGRFARQHADVVVGFSVLNEFDNQALAHEAAAGAGTAAGAAAARAVLDRAAAVIHAFAEGVRSEWDGGVVVSGGLAHPDEPVAADALLAIAPAVHAGLLDGVGVHWYFRAGAFSITSSGASLRGDALRERADHLLSTAGLPLGTPIYVQETSVRQSTFESPAAAAAAMSALLEELYADGRVQLVFPFSPWPAPEKADDYTIQAGTPVGDVVAAFAGQAPS